MRIPDVEEEEDLLKAARDALAEREAEIAESTAAVEIMEGDVRYCQAALKSIEKATIRMAPFSDDEEIQVHNHVALPHESIY